MRKTMTDEEEGFGVEEEEEQRRKMWERKELMRKKQVKMDWEEKRWKKMRNPQERRRLTRGREELCIWIWKL
jgi:hypothetical protein